MLCYVQVVQEYERAVIFRLGRISPGGAKGPGQCLPIELSQKRLLGAECLHRAVRSAFVVVVRLYPHKLDINM